jgi:hypothetical protein
MGRLPRKTGGEARSSVAPIQHCGHKSTRLAEVSTIPTPSPSSHMAIPYFASIAPPAETPSNLMSRLNAELAPSEEIDAESLRFLS